MDELYIRKVKEGDTEAFRYFLQQYGDMAYSIAISVVKHELLAEEVVQDAFLKAFRNLANFNFQSRFSTWFYRIVTNEALMQLKKRKKDALQFYPEYEENVHDEATDLAIEDKDREYLVNEALKLLPPRESLVLRLFYLEEERVKTICEITGWTESNVKVLLHRARKSMFNAILHVKNSKNN